MQEISRALGKRERNNLGRRTRLLTVARRLFDAHGVEAATVEQIAAEAELATRTVYNFFPTKVDLLAALLSEEIPTRLLSRRGKEAIPPDPREGVLALVRAQIETMASVSKAEQKLVSARAILAGGDSEAGRYNAEIDVFMRSTIRDLVASYVARGALRRDLDPDVAAGLIYAMLNGLYLEWLQSETALEAIVPVVGDYLDLILRA